VIIAVVDLLLLCIGVGKTSRISTFDRTTLSVSIGCWLLGVGEGFDADTGDGTSEDFLSRRGGDPKLSPSVTALLKVSGDPIVESPFVSKVLMVSSECEGETAAAADVHIG